MKGAGVRLPLVLALYCLVSVAAVADEISLTPRLAPARAYDGALCIDSVTPPAYR
jgi:hypothetical protein